MKICFINPTTLMKRPISELSKQLYARGHDVSILIPRLFHKEIDSSLHYSNVDSAINTITYSAINPLSGLEQPIPLTPSFFWKVHKILKENDIIHMWVPYYLTNLFILFYKKIFFPKKKLILTMDTLPGLSFSMGSMLNKAFKSYNKIFRKTLFHTPEKVTLYGESLKKYALEAGVPEEKIAILSSGIDSEKYNHIYKSKKYGWATKIIFVGIVCHRKGADQVLKIAANLPGFQFKIIGAGPLLTVYKLTAEQMQLKNVEFVGWQKDINKIYTDADLLLLPSRGEGLAGVIMEAMSSGVPVVSTNIPCTPDLITHEKEGLLADMENIFQLSMYVNDLMYDPTWRKKMAEAAKKKISKYDWKKVIKKYEDLYKKVRE